MIKISHRRCIRWGCIFERNGRKKFCYVLFRERKVCGNRFAALSSPIRTRLESREEKEKPNNSKKAALLPHRKCGKLRWKGHYLFLFVVLGVHPAMDVSRLHHAQLTVVQPISRPVPDMHFPESQKLRKNRRKRERIFLLGEIAGNLSFCGGFAEKRSHKWIPPSV